MIRRSELRADIDFVFMLFILNQCPAQKAQKV